MAQIKLNFINKVKSFILGNKLLVFILILGAFLRLFNIGEYMTFLGDEGRDAIVVRQFLVAFDPILIGPGTSVGSMYLGPLYYYFMAPWLWISNFSPIGPAIGVALLGILTIWLVFKATTDWSSKKVGLLAAFLYAISPTVIVYSRSSWNPNIMPFFALLTVYATWKAFKDSKFSYLIVAAVSFAFVLQSHYLGLLLAPVVAWIYFWNIFSFDGQKINFKFNKNIFKFTIISIGIFLVLMSPLLIFDARHDFLNSKALYKFLTVRQETVSIKPWSALPKIYPIFEQINASVLTAKNELGAMIISWFLVAATGFYLFFKRNKLWPILHLVVWYLFGLIGFGLYKQHIYDHYFGFLFPVVVIIFSYYIARVWESKNLLLKFIVLLFVLYIAALNFIKNPLNFHPNKQMQRSMNVAREVDKISAGQRYNFAVIADSNYEAGYEYFLRLYKSPFVYADHKDPGTLAEILVVVCEKVEDKCDPTHSPKAQVANFGWSKVVDKFVIDGIIIYKLERTN